MEQWSIEEREFYLSEEKHRFSGHEDNAEIKEGYEKLTELVRTRTTAELREAGSSKPMPVRKALTLLNSRVACAERVSNMKDLSENQAEDESTLFMAERLYNFTGTLSKTLESRVNNDIARELATFPEGFFRSWKIYGSYIWKAYSR